MIDWWIVLGVACGAIAAVLTWHGRRREPGAPEPEILDDTEPLDPRDDKVPPCVHGVPVSQRCERCDGVLRGKHITLDDDKPKGAA